MKQQMDIRGAAMDAYTTEHHMIAQQVKANGVAVAQLTLRQFDHEDQFEDDMSASVIFDEEEQQFENVFATKTLSNLALPRQRNQHQSKRNTRRRRRQLCHIILCLRCNFPSLMALIPKFGETTVRATSSYTRYLKVYG